LLWQHKGQAAIGSQCQWLLLRQDPWLDSKSLQLHHLLHLQLHLLLRQLLRPWL
jgi:hypothetical protein